MPNMITAFVQGNGSDAQDFSAIQTGETVIYEGTITVSNPSDDPIRILIGGAFPANAPGAEILNAGLQVELLADASFDYDSLDSLTSIDIDEVTIEPGQSAPLTVTPNDALLLLATGDEVRVLDEAGVFSADLTTAFSADELDPGEYQLMNSSAETVTVHTLRIGPDLAPPSS